MKVKVADNETDVIPEGDIPLFSEVVVVVQPNHLVHHCLSHARQSRLLNKLERKKIVNFKGKVVGKTQVYVKGFLSCLKKEGHTNKKISVACLMQSTSLPSH